MPLRRTGFTPPSKEKIAELQQKKRERDITNKDKLRARQATKSLKLAPKIRKVSTGTKTAAKLKKELDALFSKYVRQIHLNTCYTCGKTGVPLQCGHFVPRQYLATRWDLNNCRPQCPGCNIWGNGRLLDFEERLVKELGKEKVEAIKASRHQVLKLDRNWYTEQILKYKALLAE